MSRRRWESNLRPPAPEAEICAIVCLFSENYHQKTISMPENQGHITFPADGTAFASFGGGVHTGKCIRRFGGIYAYCRYFIDRKW